MTPPRRIEELRTEARYHRDRFDLYRAKAYGSGQSNASRLRELERRHRGAVARLRQALRDDGPEGTNQMTAEED